MVVNKIPQWKTLYLCYFGLREPLVQTQVLPYLREILKLEEVQVSLLTFEPNLKKNWTNEEIKSEKEKLAKENIKWFALPYHKNPTVPATIYDVINGARLTLSIVRKEKIDILHSRSIIAAMMGAIVKKLYPRSLILLLDVRGFLPEEYIDTGKWQENSKIYKLVKLAEKWLFKEADAFVVLTEKAREILFPESRQTGFDKFNRPVEVIPCCINKARFQTAAKYNREAIRQELNLNGRKVYIYIGSFGGWYLTDEIISFLAYTHQKDSSAFTIILTQREVKKVRNLLINAGLRQEDFLVKSVSPEEIPKYLKAADVALSFIKSSYSKKASSPTKIAEYLAAGLPIISNSGIGDLDELIEGEGVGVIINGFSEKDFESAQKKIEFLLQNEDLRQYNCRIAEKKFDLEKIGGERYRRIYNKIFQMKT